MRTYGDIPEHHRVLLSELETLEKWFQENGKQISTLAAAKGFTCMGHDYFMMDQDEEGERLLDMAEKSHPGYFRSDIHFHIKRDEIYATLIRQMEEGIGLDKMVELGYE